MRPLLNSSVLALAVIALMSAVAVAQTRPATPRPNRAGPPPAEGRDTMPGNRRGGPPPMQARPRMGGTGDDLLRMREQLDLSDEQVKKLEALRATARPQLNQAEMLRAQADLLDATKGDVNVDKARSAFERMARLRTDVQVSQLKSRQDARNVLTPVQRTKADAMRASMRDRRGGDMRKGGMKKRGMQQRGMGNGSARGNRGPGAGRGPDAMNR